MTWEGDPPAEPDADDLESVASFAELFDEPGFESGNWTPRTQHSDGVFTLAYWTPSETVGRWEAALYAQHIVELDSDYMDAANVELVNRAIEAPSLIAGLDLIALRRVLTFLVRAERHTGGGWFDQAFETGMAQAATKRLGEIAEEHRKQ